MNDELTDKKGTAKFLKVSVATVDRMMANGDLTYVKLSAGRKKSHVRFTLADLADFVQQRRTRAADSATEAR